MVRLRFVRPRATVAALVLLSGLSLAGCETLDQFIQPGTKDRIKGERVAVLTTDQSVDPDPKLRDSKVVLPQPFVNPDWPEPGGYADNAMHHLSAPGELKEVWSTSIGAGSSTNARLTSSPVIADGKIEGAEGQEETLIVNDLKLLADAQPMRAHEAKIHFADRFSEVYRPLVTV